jgi:polar amino acid transport system substrate-binding protein
MLLSGALMSWEVQALELLFHFSALPPYVKEDPRQGLVPEIVTRAFATQGIQCRFIRSNNKRMETEVEAGTADAGFAGIPSIIRKFFSDPVIDFENVAITLSSKNVQINSLSDLSDKKIVAFSNAESPRSAICAGNQK